MNRRNYIKTVGASAFTPLFTTGSTQAETDERDIKYGHAEVNWNDGRTQAVVAVNVPREVPQVRVTAKRDERKVASSLFYPEAADPLLYSEVTEDRVAYHIWYEQPFDRLVVSMPRTEYYVVDMHYDEMEWNFEMEEVGDQYKTY